MLLQQHAPVRTCILRELAAAAFRMGMKRRNMQLSLAMVKGEIGLLRMRYVMLWAILCFPTPIREHRRRNGLRRMAMLALLGSGCGESRLRRRARASPLQAKQASRSMRSKARELLRFQTYRKRTAFHPYPALYIATVDSSVCPSNALWPFFSHMITCSL